MTDESTICRTCRLPKKSTSAGFITQFISVCRCEEVLPEELSLPQICVRCKKAIRSSREGTITQFVFGALRCSCDRPEPVSYGSESEDYKGEAFEGFIDAGDGERELDLDSERFPSERYKPIAELGRGAAGQVYLCRDRMLGKKVALKILLELSAEQLISFQDEARTSSQLNHPNIVKTLDFGVTSGGVPFMVMEFVPGVNLETFIREEGQLDVEVGVGIARKIASALAAAHRQGVFHRDIKPSNVLLLEVDGVIEAKLIDFGVAKVKEATGSITEYQGKTLAGTPLYMPPDTVSGFGYRRASEVYSLGCVLFEMLAGEPPFSGETALEVISKHANQPSPTIQDVPPKLMSLIDSCLAKNPDRRPADMDTLIAALDEWKEDESSVVTQTVSSPLTKSRTIVAGLLFPIVCLISLAGIGWFGWEISRRPEKSEPVRIPNTIQELEQPLQDNDWKEMNNQTGDLLRAKDSVRGYLVDDPQLIAFLKEKPTETRWSFRDSYITRRGLEPMEDLTVTELTMANCNQLKNDVFPLLSNFQKLTTLTMTDCDLISDEGLENFRSKNLNRINIGGRHLSGKICEQIAKNPSLEIVEILHCPLSRANLLELKRLDKLLAISLVGTEFVDGHILDDLNSFPSLNNLRLKQINVTDEILNSICGMKKLQKLSILGVRLSERRKALLKASLPNCQFIFPDDELGTLDQYGENVKKFFNQ